jgi:hypothetical protein
VPGRCRRLRLGSAGRPEGARIQSCHAGAGPLAQRVLSTDVDGRRSLERARIGPHGGARQRCKRAEARPTALPAHRGGATLSVLTVKGYGRALSRPRCLEAGRSQGGARRLSPLRPSKTSRGVAGPPPPFPGTCPGSRPPLRGSAGSGGVLGTCCRERNCL